VLIDVKLNAHVAETYNTKPGWGAIDEREGSL
jgi:hypothetical protein